MTSHKGAQWLARWQATIETLRGEMLFDEDDHEFHHVDTPNLYLEALAHLEIARSILTRADRQEIAKRLILEVMEKEEAEEIRSRAVVHKCEAYFCVHCKLDVPENTRCPGCGA